MNKKLIFIALFFLCLTNDSFGQDYALWTSTKPYQSIYGGYHYSASYSKIEDNWSLPNPNPGIYTNIPELPIRARANEIQYYLVLNLPQVLCNGGGVRNY